MTMTKTLRTRLASASLSLLLAACWSASVPAGSRPQEKPSRHTGQGEHAIAAVVNDEVITRRDLEKLLSLESNYLALSQRYAGEELERRRAAYRKRFLNDLVEEKLLVQLARKKGLGVDSSDKEALRRRMEWWIQPYGSQARMEQEIQKVGLTLDEVQKLEADRLLIGKLQAAMLQETDWVGPAEVRGFYDGLEAHVDAGGTPGTFPPLADGGDMGVLTDERLTRSSKLAFRQIRIGVDGKTAGELAAVKQAVQDALVTGAPFEEIVKNLSEDPRASEGGLYEVVSAADLVPELGEALEGRLPGTVVGPVESQRFIYFARIESREAAGLRPFEDVQGLLRDFLRIKKLDSRIETWRQEQLAGAYIRVLEE